MLLDRRHALPLAAGAVAVCVAALLLLRGGNENERRPPAPPAADPLTFVPAAADVVFDIDLRVPLAAVAFARLLPRGVAADVPRRGRAVLALRGAQRWLAFQAPGEAAEIARRASARAPVSARRGVVVVAPAGSGTRLPPLTRADFERRLARLPRDAGIRVAFRPQALLGRFSRGVAGTRWARGLRSGAAAIIVRGTTLVVPLRLDGSGAPPDALPLAPGDATPRPSGQAPVLAGVRDPAQVLRFAREAGLLPELEALDLLPGFLRPDLEQLGPEGTLTSDGGGTVTVRLAPPDPGDWSRKLDRLDALSGLGRALGVADVRIDRRGDTYRIESRGRFALNAGVYGDALVLSTSETADLAAAARPPAVAPTGGAQGALVGSVASSVLLDVLERRFGVSVPRLVRLSPLTGWLRAGADGGIAGELRLTVSL